MDGAPSSNRVFRIGTRASPLARAQAAEIVASVRLAQPQIRPEIVTLTTYGDRNRDVPISSMERGVFAKEITRALLAGTVDAAVHSAKDLPADSDQGAVIAAVSDRADPRDVLINRWNCSLADLRFWCTDRHREPTPHCPARQHSAGSRGGADTRQRGHANRQGKLGRD